MAASTRRGALMYCLEILLEERRIISQEYLGREPVKGKEERFNILSGMIDEIRELIRACDSEPVRAAIANWQKMIMDGKQPDLKDLERPGKE